MKQESRLRKLLLAASAALALVAASGVNAQQQGPSFNCNYAKAPDEVLICQNPELATQDREMASFYSWIMNNFKGGFRAYIQATQSEWLQRRQACRYDAKCIGELYDDRMVTFGDGDITWSEFCRNHQTDIDCRIRPDGYDPVPRDVCRVLDPTGTPLNVRTTPNGNIAGSLKNDERVVILDQSRDAKKRQWVYVGSYEDRNKPIGWVYRQFIDCRN